MNRLVLATTTLVVLLAFLPTAATPPTYTQSLIFEDECLDFDTGAVESSCEDLDTETSTWDIMVAYHAERGTHSVVFHNPYNTVEVAHLENTTFEQVTTADIDAAPLAQHLIDQPFDALRVLLVRTDLGAVYKLGHTSEDGSALRFDYELLSPAP